MREFRYRIFENSFERKSYPKTWEIIFSEAFVAASSQEKTEGDLTSKLYMDNSKSLIQLINNFSLATCSLSLHCQPSNNKAQFYSEYQWQFTWEIEKNKNNHVIITPFPDEYLARRKLKINLS